MNFVEDVTLIAAAIKCPTCGFTRPPRGRNWGVRFIQCKPCELKRMIVGKSKPEDPDPRVKYFQL